MINYPSQVVLTETYAVRQVMRDAVMAYWNRSVRALGLFSCGGDNIKANEGVETGRSSLHDLQSTSK